MTSGKLQAVIEYKTTIEGFYGRLEELTGNAHAEQLGAVFASTAVKTSVMASVKSIGSQQYNPSHIVTAFGVASSNPRASTLRSLAILNPAVKVQNSRRNICDLDGVKNDERWSAEVSLEPVYELTRFPEGYLIMWIRFKP
jgi:hypothetical protein